MRHFLTPPVSAELELGPPPTFSVIIAAYQVADVIGDALESIRAQTRPSLETIVCDDGSTDGIEEALAPYQDDVIILRKENGGEASAKNAAAAHARGDFIAILDADDVYMPERLEALAELAQMRSDLDILTTDALLSANGVTVRHNYDRTWSFDVSDQRRAILQRNFIFGHAAVRRTRFFEFDGFDESIRWTTDWDLWLRMILAGASAGCVDEPLSMYRLRQESLTAQRRHLAVGRLRTLEKARDNQELRDDERPVLEASIASYRRELSLIELRAAVASGEPGTSRRALSMLRESGLARRRKLEAATIALAPWLARRLLGRREKRSWVGAGGTRISRTPRNRAA